MVAWARGGLRSPWRSRNVLSRPALNLGFSTSCGSPTTPSRPTRWHLRPPSAARGHTAPVDTATDVLVFGILKNL